MAENRAVLPPDGGQAAADDLRMTRTHDRPHHQCPSVVWAGVGRFQRTKKLRHEKQA